MRLLLHPKAKKYIQKLDKSERDRIKHYLAKIQDDPLRHLDYFRTQKCFKLRLGDHRALVDLDTKNDLVIIRVLDHRKRIYKRP